MGGGGRLPLKSAQCRPRPSCPALAVLWARPQPPPEPWVRCRSSGLHLHSSEMAQLEVDWKRPRGPPGLPTSPAAHAWPGRYLGGPELEASVPGSSWGRPSPPSLREPRLSVRWVRSLPPAAGQGLQDSTRAQQGQCSGHLTVASCVGMASPEIVSTDLQLLGRPACRPPLTSLTSLTSLSTGLTVTRWTRSQPTGREGVKGPTAPRSQKLAA